MSLLRVCAFAKCLSRRRFLEKCASVGVSNAGCCQLCVSVRSATVRRISGTPLQLQKINISSVIPKTEDAKKRVLEQSQLLDVLKARIQQLQSDTVLDVHHAEVQFLKAPSHGKSSARGPRSTPQEKTDIPKTGQTVAKVTSKSQPNCWTAKLIQEKKIKTLQKIQYVLKKNPVKSPPKNFSEVKKIGGQMEEKKIKTLQKIQYVVKKTPVKSRQKIFSKVKKIGGQMEEKKIKTLQKIQYVVKKETVKSKKKLSSEVKKIGGQMELSATSASVTAGTAAAGKATEPQKLSEKNPDSKKLELLLTHNEQAKMDWLENRSSQQVSQSANVAKHPQLASENVFCRDITVNICSYLEACVFMGDIERAHHFLLSWHRILTRRKRLSTRVYNILMKEWAKKGMLHQIGHIFILLSEAGLKPNLESYCSALECMGRNPKSFPKDISRCLAHMKEDGLSLDDLFNQCVFRQDEWDMVLNAIRVVQPDYEPTLNLHTSQCSSPLVQDFYTKREDHTFPKLDFTQKELQKRFQHQLSVERSCTITIDSVEATKPVTENMAKMRELLAEQRQLWRNVLLHALRESKKILANTSTKHYKFNIYPYLCLLTDAEYVDIMIQSVSSLPPSGEPLTSLAQTLSERIYTKYAVQQNYKNQTVKKLGRVYNAYTALLAKDTKVYSVLPREQWCKLEVEHISGPTLHGGTTSWPYDVTLELGTYLVEIMVKHQKINSNILNPAHQGKLIPILYHMYIYRNIRQDGSCNGLQHYAALGRDVIGAKSVNLMPCDLPQDVYSSVAQQVEEFRARDAENGLKVAQVLEGFISRKVVKQTVMTVVYGVTRYGGRLQIEKKLKEFDEFPEEYIWEASHYLVRLVFCGLKEMFTGTREIQDWLTDSARHISKMGHAVEWVTPLGLPIIQPYHRNQVLRSTMQNVSIQISHDITHCKGVFHTRELHDMEGDEIASELQQQRVTHVKKPNVMKQKNAFPPNFIHSLDSTHMMLTSLHCYSGGLTFVSVHDCFWTHALTVETMNKACREQFVALHSQPILEELSNFLVHKYCSKPPAETSKKRYQDYKRLRLLLSSLPQRGDFDLQQVKDSIYFFS
ncbi:DNA-directed RNA polymerase, mitochondrial isoform 5-T5 [Pholidichthys leucotaenia]